MNPSVSRGVPRTIEWDHLEDETELHHINAYERERPNEERKRGEELLLEISEKQKKKVGRKPGSGKDDKLKKQKGKRDAEDSDKGKKKKGKKIG